MYNKFFKRLFDWLLSLIAILLLSPLLLLLTLAGAIAMGGNPFFVQKRPGKDERIFCMIKFRSMTDHRDKKTGRLLSDEERLTRYGRFLRATSLDELPELFNIFAGQMSFVGPRPMLVRDMVFMTPAQRGRHSVRPGLTGLAQANGRNSVTWEKKLAFDLEYVEHITLWGDVKILFKTVFSVLKREGIAEEGMATAADLGDYLLYKGEITQEEYDRGQAEAGTLLKQKNP
ncbi:MAG: sugar transferase [Clostridia bacterium]|nr:sugar transferase [Clostridia bacterium]